MIKGGKMKKKIILWFTIIILFIACIFVYCFGKKDDKKSGNNLKKVTVAEVAHSVFYAPQYLADALGYFEDEGLDVEINLAAGADAVMSAVLSNDADIGFCGTEATIYVVAY
jgi:NitT/TauT family transport system substrate-binding protein